MSLTRLTKGILAGALVAAICVMPGRAEAVTYSFVGQWRVDQVNLSETSFFPFTGQEAAAYLFGGSASNYAISTAGTDMSAITFSNWVTVWGAGAGSVNGDCASGFPCGNIVAQDFKTDNGVIGFYDRTFFPDVGLIGDTSALGRDWAQGAQFTNYAFLVTPLPAALPLFGTGLGLMSLFGWWRRRRAAVA